jgi:serine protease Do
MRRIAPCLLVALVAAAPAMGDAAARRARRETPVVLAYRKARPAVVNISTEKIISTSWGLFGRDIFEDIFPSPFRRAVPVHSLGSGFLVHPAGYVVTNAHVVRRAQKITVTLADNSKHPARIISADEKHDLAVLKMDPPKGDKLAHLPLGRSDDLMVGETVIAIGNPLGYQHTVTRGIISALDRKLEFASGVAYEGIIQTDAPINSGSSGGPLLNACGELIGINTAIRADAQNIGFAIPVDALIQQFPDLLDFERINRAVFGAKVLQRHTDDGDELYVAEVRPGTPAAGKLRVGDRLVELDGRAVRQIPDFTCALLSAGVPTTARLKCLRGGEAVAVTVPVQAKPRPDGRLLARGLFGLTLREVTPQLAREQRLPLDSGLMIVGIDADGPAHRIGLQLRDVVFQVANYYVADLDDLGILLEDVRPGQVVRLGVARGGTAAWVQIRARNAPAAAPRPKAGTRRPLRKGEI